MAFDTSLLGQPVELGRISRELKQIWETSGGAKSRASLVNFAVYCEGTDALESNTKLISEFTRNHACRAILLANVPTESGQRVQAWINAHCHLSRAGAKQVCCEQITLLIEKASQGLLSNVLFANLDSDLPLYLWWQGPLEEPLSEQLLTWVDRLIFDSKDWAQPKEQFSTLRNALDRSGARLILCDLNWTRTLYLRQALAQMFDYPENLTQVPSLDRLTINHAPDHRCTALLFAAWVAAQLRWEFQSKTADRITFKSAAGADVTCELKTVAGAPISCCELSGGSLSVAIHRDEGSAFHRAEVRRPSDGQIIHHLLPAGGDDRLSLLDDELTFGGRHRVYMKALAAAEGLL